MSALNDITATVGAGATKADLKNYIYALHNYLVGLFGSDGVKATAIATLGAAPFPAGTKMLFAQGSAPPGWTKQTTHNDKTLRVVSGTSGGGSGGSVAFSTLFGRTATDGSSLSIAQLAAHTHSYIKGGSSASTSAQGSSYGTSSTTGSTGSGETHSHGIDLRLQYVDVIIASKD